MNEKISAEWYRKMSSPTANTESSSSAEIKEVLETILERLESFDKRLSQIEASTGKMDGHIDFVETVYNQVQAPFHALVELASRITPALSAIPPRLLQYSLRGDEQPGEEGHEVQVEQQIDAASQQNKENDPEDEQQAARQMALAPLLGLRESNWECY